MPPGDCFAATETGLRHVTNATDRSVELRAIASAKDAPTLWELRREIREKRIAYLREEHPDALPVVRAQLRDGRDRAPTSPEETGPT